MRSLVKVVVLCACFAVLGSAVWGEERAQRVDRVGENASVSVAVNTVDEAVVPVAHRRYYYYRGVPRYYYRAPSYGYYRSPYYRAYRGRYYRVYPAPYYRAYRYYGPSYGRSFYRGPGLYFGFYF